MVTGGEIISPSVGKVSAGIGLSQLEEPDRMSLQMERLTQKKGGIKPGLVQSESTWTQSCPLVLPVPGGCLVAGEGGGWGRRGWVG